MITSNNIRSLLEPLLDGSDFIIVDVKVQGARGRVGFQILIDHRSRGLNIQECSQWSRKFEDVLDMTDYIPRQYSLDVSSPGISFPLTYDWQFKKNIGRSLEIIMKKKDEDGAKVPEVFTGELLSFNDNTLELADGIIIAIEDIKKARVKLPW